MCAMGMLIIIMFIRQIELKTASTATIAHTFWALSQSHFAFACVSHVVRRSMEN